MDGWIDRWIDRRTDGRTDDDDDGWTDGRKDRRMDGHIDYIVQEARLNNPRIRVNSCTTHNIGQSCTEMTR
jgi:hypothetical protein